MGNYFAFASVRQANGELMHVEFGFTAMVGSDAFLRMAAAQELTKLGHIVVQVFSVSAN